MSLPVTVVTFFLCILKWLQLPISYWKSRKKGKPLPLISNPLLEVSATRLAEMIRQRMISSEELVSAYIERIKEVNTIINAVVEERFQAALQDAKNVDKYLTENDIEVEMLERTLPLLGIPVTIKEACSVAGMSYAVGSVSRMGMKAETDGKAVAHLKAAGAIPLLVTNTPEFCLDAGSINFITGVTCNPYNTNRTSGGSSSGEGALLAAGGSVIGLGSDIAGSIRLPCSYNGIFGHKPSNGLIPVDGHFPNTDDKTFNDCLTIGPMTRYAEDLKLLVRVLSGNSFKPNDEISVTDITVYFMEDSGSSIFSYPTQKEIRLAVRDAATYLGNVCGCEISDVKFEGLAGSFALSVALFFRMEGLPHIFDTEKTFIGMCFELIKSTLRLSKIYQHSVIFYLLMRTHFCITRNEHRKFKKELRDLKLKLSSTLGTSGVFLYPTFPTTAFPHNVSLARATGLKYPMIFNLLGFPVTTVPIGFDGHGLPVGIQVVAAPNQDHLCLTVALELEKGFGGWKRPWRSENV